MQTPFAKLGYVKDKKGIIKPFVHTGKIKEEPKPKAQPVVHEHYLDKMDRLNRELEAKQK